MELLGVMKSYNDELKAMEQGKAVIVVERNAKNVVKQQRRKTTTS
jgi:hypothetical protein